MNSLHREKSDFSKDGEMIAEGDPRIHLVFKNLSFLKPRNRKSCDKAGACHSAVELRIPLISCIQLQGTFTETAVLTVRQK